MKPIVEVFAVLAALFFGGCSIAFLLDPYTRAFLPIQIIGISISVGLAYAVWKAHRKPPTDGQD